MQVNIISLSFYVVCYIHDRYSDWYSKVPGGSVVFIAGRGTILRACSGNRRQAPFCSFAYVRAIGSMRFFPVPSQRTPLLSYAQSIRKPCFTAEMALYSISRRTETEKRHNILGALLGIILRLERNVDKRQDTKSEKWLRMDRIDTDSFKPAFLTRIGKNQSLKANKQAFPLNLTSKGDRYTILIYVGI